jgi:hypothetical protein
MESCPYATELTIAIRITAAMAIEMKDDFFIELSLLSLGLLLSEQISRQIYEHCSCNAKIIAFGGFFYFI